MALEDYLTANEAAQRLRVHPETVKRLCRQGDLPAEKIRNTWLIHSDILGRVLPEPMTPGLAPGNGWSETGMSHLSHISLFTGAGGLDIGIERAGFTTLVAVEKDKPRSGKPWILTGNTSCTPSSVFSTM